MVAQELTRGKLRPLLARINVVLVPTTAENQTELASTEDHLQLNTASAQMLAKLAQAQQATVVLTADEVPAMTTIGSQTAMHLADVAVLQAHLRNLPEFLTRATDQWFAQPMAAALQAEALRTDGSQTLLPSGAREENSVIAAALKNRIGLQVLTAGSDLGRAHVQRRVHAHVTAISNALASTARRAAELSELKPYLDREVTTQACRQPVVIEAAPNPADPAPQMQAGQWLNLNTGAEITIAPSATDAGRREQQPGPLLSRIKPCGYWLAATAGQAVQRLRLHGVQVMRVAEPASLLGDTYLGFGLVRGVIDAPVDSFYVPVDQPYGNLVVAVLEPDAASSFATQGLVNVEGGLARIMTPPTVRLEALP